jgi:hypothetical protein
MIIGILIAIGATVGMLWSLLIAYIPPVSEIILNAFVGAFGAGFTGLILTTPENSEYQTLLIGFGGAVLTVLARHTWLGILARK